MLTIVCGEDSTTSRTYYLSLKNVYIKKNYFINEIKSNEIVEIPKWLGSAQMLFNQKRVFFSENIIKNTKGKLSAKFTQILTKISKTSFIELIDWEEDTPSRYLKIKNIGVIKEFKPSETIFKLLDNFYPGNLKKFLRILNIISNSANENFIFIMLSRQVRNLILAKINKLSTSIPSWQKQKLLNQAKFWRLNDLLTFYEALSRLDISTKTSSNPLGLKKAIDILAYHFL